MLVLTDMFGGTPANLGVTFLEANRVEVITGVNLPMLIKLARLEASTDLLAVAREMREHGRQRHLGRLRPAERDRESAARPTARKRRRLVK